MSFQPPPHDGEGPSRIAPPGAGPAPASGTALHPRRRVSDKVDVEQILAGGGEMGALMRSIDWTKTSFGAMETWPKALLTALSICLNSKTPILIWWGSELYEFYNDAYRPIMGATKHPRGMGARGEEIWPEIWHIMGPIFEQVLTEGKSLRFENQFMILDRNGFDEETHFTHAHSPIFDESGTISGVFTIVNETTGQVIGERRLQALHHLAAYTAKAASVEEACSLSINALAECSVDLPFALLYLLGENGAAARLAGATGLGHGVLTPTSVALGPDESQEPLDDPWELASVFRSGLPRRIDRLCERFGPLPLAPSPLQGAGEVPPPAKTCLVLPLKIPGDKRSIGALVLGVSARLPFDDRYRNFLELVSAHIETALASARMLAEAEDRARALAELDKAKTAFFSNVSHEFRTPLTLMLGPTEDILAGAYGELAPELRGQLELIRRNELRLQRLVNALLDFSRIEAGRRHAAYESLETLELAALTLEVASSFRSVIERTGLSFKVDCPSTSAGLKIFVDRNMWEQIILNLLSNAFKFTFEGSIALVLRIEAEDAVLVVEDTGVGVEQAELPRLFERFHRVESIRARTHEGSGIGLALVSELVRLHGGTISVESTVGKGTAFTVKIPTGDAHLPKERIVAVSGPAYPMAPLFVEEAARWNADMEEEGTARANVDEAFVRAIRPTPSSGTSRGYVLVADDNADMRKYLQRILSVRFDVEIVSDGKAALESARKRPPDIILTDAMMPGLDGFGLMRALHADSATADIPIIMLSARAGEESRIEGIEAGADDYLIKPFSARELLARVQSHLKLAAAKRSIARQWQELMTVLDKAPVSTALVAMPEQRYEFVNEAHKKMLGRDVTGLRIDQAHSELKPQEMEQALAVCERVFTTGEPLFSTQLSRTTADGTTFYYNSTMGPWLDQNGRRRGIMSMTFDVTGETISRRRAEEMHHLVEQSERKLRQMMERWDAFLSVATHELRTPLTTFGLQIDGLVRSLDQPAPPAEEGSRGISPSAVSRWLTKSEALRTQANRLEQLIEGILHVFSFGREPIELRREKADLADLAREVVTRLGRESKRAEAAIRLRAYSVPGNWDVERIDQVIAHLLTSSLNFGPGKAIDVVVEEAGNAGRLTIVDRGQSPDSGDGDAWHLHRTIEPRAADGVGRPVGRATGLAYDGGFGLHLWVVREIVNAMNGAFLVEHHNDDETTFIVEIPRHP